MSGVDGVVFPVELTVRAWSTDRGVALFPVQHEYVEMLWLPVIGPSSTWLLRRLGSWALAFPDGVSVVLPWGSLAEQAQARAIADPVAVAAGEASIVIAPRLSLAECASLLAGARMVAGVDTGLTHLAAAVGCPTVVLHGPTDPARTGAAGRVRTLIGAGPAGLAAMCPQRVAWAAQMAVGGEDLHVSQREAMISRGGGPLAQLAEQGTLNP